jgi:low temperature requirement protein LtrA
MSQPRRSASLLRERGGHEARVGFVELFFDLVFVFAVTQLSHHLLKHLSPQGAFETLLLFLAVWWVWIYTTWITNWLDPERTPVRLMLLALMLAGLVLSTSIPTAFDEGGLTFAAAYVSMQVGRSVFMLWALGDEQPANSRNFQRITVWLSVSGVFWIFGGFAEDGLRVALWVIAISLEYASPACGFYVPGLGRSVTTDWDVEGGHIAERCGLFIIIALGESILVTGATFAELEWTRATLAAFVAAFVGSVAMWWIYFDTGARRASEHIAHAADPGRLGRFVYTYVHFLIVGGIIVGAVADELVLAHPTGHVEAAAVAAILGGPALYLVGNILFKHTIAGRPPLSHLVGLALLGLLALAAFSMSPLVLGTGATLVLVLVAAWERISLSRGPARPELS